MEVSSVLNNSRSFYHIKQKKLDSIVGIEFIIKNSVKKSLQEVNMIKEFFRYAVPSALAMFISSLYTVIDGIFVGQGVGDTALASVNIVLPFTVMLFGLASMFAIVAFHQQGAVAGRCPLVFLLLVTGFH